MFPHECSRQSCVGAWHRVFEAWQRKSDRKEKTAQTLRQEGGRRRGGWSRATAAVHIDGYTNHQHTYSGTTYSRKHSHTHSHTHTHKQTLMHYSHNVMAEITLGLCDYGLQGSTYHSDQNQKVHNQFGAVLSNYTKQSNCWIHGKIPSCLLISEQTETLHGIHHNYKKQACGYVIPL